MDSADSVSITGPMGGLPMAAASRRPADLQFMLGQFQARYPMASLTSELLQIHQGNYVVRAAVQMGGVVLATGLAAAEVIELAEDRARMRVLEVVGIASTPPPAAPIPEKQSSAYELQFRLMANHSNETAPRLNQVTQNTVFANSVSYDSPQLMGQPVPVPSALPEPTRVLTMPMRPELTAGRETGMRSPEIEDEPELESFSYAPEMRSPQPTAPPEPPSAKPKRSSRNSSAEVASTEDASQTRQSFPREVTAAPNPTREPLDLSEIIAQTTVEVKRLGWDSKQGAIYLQRTYGKSSRQQLTDEELLEFLEYLRSQPTPTESPF